VTQGEDDVAGRLLDELRRRHGVPGLVVAAISDDERVLRCAGVDPATDRPIEATTRFQIGSISKLLAAMTAASVRDLDWYAPLERVAPRTAGLIERNGHRGDLTVARLASHTAGLSVHGFLGYGPGEEIPTLAGVVAGVGNSERIEVVVEPGTEFRYSGGGYAVLEMVLEEVTGTPFDELVAAAVFEPAGMSTASFTTRDGDSGGAVNGSAMAEHSRRFVERAAAGVWASGRDLRALVAALGRARAEPEAPLAAAFARVSAPAELADGRASGSGHGVERLGSDDRRWYSHRGRTLGYCSHLVVDDTGRFGVAVATNAFPEGTELAHDVIADLARELGWPSSPPRV
jgi:CubicO group peptidase (beta-lactamase class C family)